MLVHLPPHNITTLTCPKAEIGFAVARGDDMEKGLTPKLPASRASC